MHTVTCSKEQGGASCQHREMCLVFEHDTRCYRVHIKYATHSSRSSRVVIKHALHQSGEKSAAPLAGAPPPRPPWPTHSWSAPSKGTCVAVQIHVPSPRTAVFTSLTPITKCRSTCHHCSQPLLPHPATAQCRSICPPSTWPVGLAHLRLPRLAHLNLRRLAHTYFFVPMLA